MLRCESEKLDLIPCLDVQPGRIGDELVGREAAVRAWGVLSRMRAFHFSAIEAEPSVQGHRVVGFGASLFVSAEFANEEISNPRPGLNSRIIASVVNGRNVALTEEELRRDNATGELHLVVMFGSFRAAILSTEELLAGHSLLTGRFVESRAGYQTKLILNELVDETEKEYRKRIHGWTVISTFDEYWAKHPAENWGRSRVLSAIDRDTLMLGGLRCRHRPVLRLREPDQELLLAALTGLTDEELAARLHLSLPGVKKRWLTLFERTVQARPDLFPDFGEEDGLSSRGRQKRHHLLAFVRSRPEELRPYEWDAAVRARTGVRVASELESKP